MKAFIKKTQFGFQYRKEGDTMWTYFPDNVKLTPEGMKTYLQRGSRDEPDLIYANKAGQSCKHYSIKPGERYGGHLFATVDGGEKFLFDTSEFVPDADKLDFLKNHSTRQQDLEADKIENLNERVKYYLSLCADETKAEFKQFIDEKMTPDVLRELCANNAKTYELPAEIEFIEK